MSKKQANRILTPKQVAAIAARADKATPGPWRVDEGWGGWRDIDAANGTKVIGNYDCDAGGVASHPEDAAFIAAARANVPALVASHEALRATVETLKKRIEDWAQWSG